MYEKGSKTSDIKVPNRIQPILEYSGVLATTTVPAMRNTRLRMEERSDDDEGIIIAVGRGDRQWGG